MATIQSGATSDLLTVDPTSKAARITSYDTSGNTQYLVIPTGSYLLPVQIRQTATTASPATVWAMTNSNTITCSIKKIVLSTSFDGTAAASTGYYQVLRFTTATPTGGTQITPAKKRTGYASSNVTDARFVDTGLTTTNVVFDNAFMQINVCRQNGSSQTVQMLFDLTNSRSQCFELAPNEGLCIRTGATAVVGDALSGYVEWDER